MLSRLYCPPPPNIFPFVADDPSVAVWRICLVCALLLGAEAILLWRARTLRAATLPSIVVLGCFALAVAAWLQSRDFIQVVCATGLGYSLDEYQRVAEREDAAIHLNQIYQYLTIAACAITFILLVWGVVRFALSARRPRTA